MLLCSHSFRAPAIQGNSASCFIKYKEAHSARFVVFITTRLIKSYQQISEDSKMKWKAVMFTGDSITDCNRGRPIGDGFGSIGDSYLSRIFVDTWADMPNHHIKYLNSATSGNTSKMLLDRFDEEVLAYNPDYLFIMIGVNDIWRHFDGGALREELISVEQTVENMRTMIEKTRAQGAVPVILSPYFLETDRTDPMRRMCDEINAGYKKLAEEYGIGYIDIQTPLDRYVAAVGSSYLLSGDRVHPKAVGCALIAKCIYNHPAFRVIFDD